MTNVAGAAHPISTPILVRLKTTTRAEHESVERRMDLFSRMRNVPSYIKLLELFWGFFHPLEDALCAVPGIGSVLPDLRSRLRSGLLKDDFSHLGMPANAIEDLRNCTELPPIRTMAQALGCLYVLEGSTLGGQIIGRHLRQGDPAISQACSFFLSHGENVGSMWKKFSAAAETYVFENPRDADAICASASQTFSSLETWIAVIDAS